MPKLPPDKIVKGFIVKREMKVFDHETMDDTCWRSCLDMFSNQFFCLTFKNKLTHSDGSQWGERMIVPQNLGPIYKLVFTCALHPYLPFAMRGCAAETSPLHEDTVLEGWIRLGYLHAKSFPIRKGLHSRLKFCKSKLLIVLWKVP